MTDPPPGLRGGPQHIFNNDRVLGFQHRALQCAADLLGVDVETLDINDFPAEAIECFS